jgi:hypothetical protein
MIIFLSLLFPLAFANQLLFFNHQQSDERFYEKCNRPGVISCNQVFLIEWLG